MKGVRLLFFTGASFIIIIISQIVAWIILFMEEDVMNGNVLAIVIALIGVAGGIWTQVVQFKKDSQRIDRVNSTVGNVKNDTSEMKPKVENTDRNCNIIRDDITRMVLPQMNTISDLQSGLAELIEAKHLDDKIKSRVSASIDNPFYIINSVNLVYERNARLEIEKAELINEKFQLQAQIQNLQNEKDILRSENEKLFNEVNVLKRNIRKMEGRNDAGTR